MEPIIFTDKAALQAKQIIAKKKGDALKLRVYVTGGGCSGFEYGFKLDAEKQDNDMVVTNQGVELLIDHLSMQYLLNSTVDFTSGIEGSKFFVENPNAKTTCGCGSSFSI